MWRAISSGVKPRLLVFQKAQNYFKQRPQLVLVVFIGGPFAKSHPLFLICHIGQISRGFEQLRRRRWSGRLKEDSENRLAGNSTEDR